MIQSGKKYLLCTDEFFMCPSGLSYRAIYGTAWVKNFQETFGFPAKNHANWYVNVSPEEDKQGIIIAGCRINYATQMDAPPPIYLTNMVITKDPATNVQYNWFYPNIYIANE